MLQVAHVLARFVWAISKQKAVAFVTTSAFLWFVASMLRWNPRPCACLTTRRGERTDYPWSFLSSGKRWTGDDDRDYLIRQQIANPSFHPAELRNTRPRTNVSLWLGYKNWTRPLRIAQRLVKQAKKEKENIKKHLQSKKKTPACI